MQNIEKVFRTELLTNSLLEWAEKIILNVWIKHGLWA